MKVQIGDSFIPCEILKENLKTVVVRVLAKDKRTGELGFTIKVKRKRLYGG